MNLLSEKIKSLPLSSGVYLMKDDQGKIIYVGKAVSLRKRVQSYFRKKGNRDPKTTLLVSRIKDIDYILTASEAEALILEASLIKKHRPRYNVNLKDDKSYPYIEITSEAFPKVSIQRPRVKNKKSEYYGPYVNAKLIREALLIIRKIFPFRSCKHLPGKSCLDYHIGLCRGPCVEAISQQEYQKNIQNIRFILEGEKDELYKDLQEEMEDLSRKKEYERAARVRDQIQAIGALYSGTGDVNYFKEAEQLKRAFQLSRDIHRIEAFDISNIMGNQAVGAMVSFFNGKPDKSYYRRFKIREVDGIDDFKMVAEVIKRRYWRLKNEGLPYPDLILIDGGKGQLSAGYEQLQKLQLDIPLISLAKREEEIFLPTNKNSVKLQKDSLGLKLLQRVRDEAHRFAVSYHKYLRAKALVPRKKIKKKRTG